jgi:DNA-binding transcriptional LysR family regulator
MGTAAQRTALRQGEIDVAFMYTLPDGEFTHHQLQPESLVIAVPKDHPLATRQSIGLKEVMNERFVLPSLETAEVLHYAVLAECADAGFQPCKVQDVSTAQTALGLVSAGFGISVLPASVHSIMRKDVVLRPIRNSRLQIRLTLMWQGSSPSPIVPKLLECIS